MLLDFNQYQLERFDDVASKIAAAPELYADFDSVSDFYKADWLYEFPHGTTWAASGLDDGAEEFYAIIRFLNRSIVINARGGQIQIERCIFSQ
nr:hypothetical protein [Acinetobacter sp. Marseille-Q1620]